jgi:hypothetical protein
MCGRHRGEEKDCPELQKDGVFGREDTLALPVVTRKRDVLGTAAVVSPRSSNTGK